MICYSGISKTAPFHWPEIRVGSRHENIILTTTLENVWLLGRVYASSECLCIVLFKAKKKYAHLQENIQIGITKICICFLEDDLHYEF